MKASLMLGFSITGHRGGRTPKKGKHWISLSKVRMALSQTSYLGSICSRLGESAEAFDSLRWWYGVLVLRDCT
jgi:hypothetical protein